MLHSDGGWPVDGCYAGSPAEEAGILAGDRIAEIGGCQSQPDQGTIKQPATWSSSAPQALQSSAGIQ